MPLITLAFSVSNMLLCFSFFYLEQTAPVIYVCQKWQPIYSNEFIKICNKYFSTKKAKADNNYNKECREYYDELLSVLNKYESIENEICHFDHGLGFEIIYYYLISYTILIVFLFKYIPSFFVWWQFIILFVLNIGIDILIAFVVSRIDLTKDNFYFQKYSYVEYEFPERELQPLNPDNFDDILSYLKAEHERSFDVLARRINAYYNCSEYYKNSIHKKDARVYCLACVCAYFILIIS